MLLCRCRVSACGLIGGLIGVVCPPGTVYAHLCFCVVYNKCSLMHTKSSLRTPHLMSLLQKTQHAFLACCHKVCTQLCTEILP